MIQYYCDDKGIFGALLFYSNMLAVRSVILRKFIILDDFHLKPNVSLDEIMLVFDFVRA